MENVQKARELLGESNNVEYMPFGVGSKHEVLRFSKVSDNCSSGSFSDDGDEELEVVTIDDTVKDKATFIKMDIEGMELEALKGAENTIKKYKPKLAICVYHKPADIADITEYILSIRDDYKIYMRHYFLGLQETVMYFV